MYQVEGAVCISSASLHLNHRGRVWNTVYGRLGLAIGKAGMSLGLSIRLIQGCVCVCVYQFFLTSTINQSMCLWPDAGYKVMNVTAKVSTHIKPTVYDGVSQP